MYLIYNRTNYCAAEYPAQNGCELVDKHCQRGTFFQGDVADRFAKSLRDAFAAEGASVERLDAFLGDFDGLMLQSVLYH